IRARQAVELKQVELERFMKGLKVPGEVAPPRPAHEQARLRIRRDGPRAGTGGKPAGRKPSPTKPPQKSGARKPSPRKPGPGRK
ncbi:MAG: hypothetical protein ACK44Y_14870, partial [Novosphingobium sp.]